MSRKTGLGLLLGVMTALAILVAFSSSTMAQSITGCPPKMYLVTTATATRFGIVSSTADINDDGLVCLLVLPVQAANKNYPCNVNTVPNRPVANPYIWKFEEITAIEDENFAPSCPPRAP